MESLKKVSSAVIVYLPALLAKKPLGVEREALASELRVLLAELKQGVRYPLEANPRAVFLLSRYGKKIITMLEELLEFLEGRRPLDHTRAEEAVSIFREVLVLAVREEQKTIRRLRYGL